LSGCARWKLKKTKTRACEAGTGGVQQPGNADVPKQRETSTETLKRHGRKVVLLRKWPELQKKPRDSRGPGTYKEVLTNIKIAIFKEAYPEDKLTEDDLNNILEELGRELCGTPLGELPHLKSCRLEGGALIYTCANQQSGQWLVRATDNHRLGSGARLKANDARNLPKPVKVALRVWDKVAQSQD
jgi:hypothetical protein